MSVYIKFHLQILYRFRISVVYVCKILACVYIYIYHNIDI